MLLNVEISIAHIVKQKSHLVVVLVVVAVQKHDLPFGPRESRWTLVAFSEDSAPDRLDPQTLHLGIPGNIEFHIFWVL